MSKRATRVLAATMAAAGMVALAGCQEEGAEDATSVAGETRNPSTDDAAGATTAAPPPGAYTEETGAERPTSTETADTASTMTAGTVPSPTAEEAATPTADEGTDPTPTPEQGGDVAPTADEGNDEEEPVAVGDVIVVQDGAVFTTPAQAAFCSLSAPSGGMEATVTCEVAQSSVPPGEELMGICPADGYGWYFNFFENLGHGGFWCNHHDGIVHLPGHDLAGDPWVNQSQVHVTALGTRVPILDYGRVLQAGSLFCSVQPNGLTCASPVSGHGFTVNTASYVSW